MLQLQEEIRQQQGLTPSQLATWMLVNPSLQEKQLVPAPCWDWLLACAPCQGAPWLCVELGLAWAKSSAETVLVT